MVFATFSQFQNIASLFKKNEHFYLAPKSFILVFSGQKYSYWDTVLHRNKMEGHSVVL